MRAVFGIDVSKASSEVAVLVNHKKVHGYTIPNDGIGFSRLLDDLNGVHQPEIIFEATGVYSRRLQAFLEDHKPSVTNKDTCLTPLAFIFSSKSDQAVLFSFGDISYPRISL